MNPQKELLQSPNALDPEATPQCKAVPSFPSLRLRPIYLSKVCACAYTYANTIYICVYAVCIYIYMYECMNVCMYVCMCMHIQIHACMHACMHAYIWWSFGFRV